MRLNLSTRTILAAAIASFWLCAPAQAQRLAILHSFDYANKPSLGFQPHGPVAIDPGTGTLFGTASGGGLCYACGTVFALSADRTGLPRKLRILHKFDPRHRHETYTDGEDPQTGVQLDPAGNLYGTTLYGGELDSCMNGRCGVVFMLQHP